MSIRDLRVGFAGADGTLDVLHGVDLDIPRGGTLGIVGESGCGKSVTMLAVMGLLGKRGRARGSVVLDGSEILGLAEPEMERVRGKRIAMIFQDPMSSLNPVHRIGTQIGEALTLHRGIDGAAARLEAERLLDRVGIASARQRLSEYPHQLSGGMNQRVMIAMALAGEPDILIADEPTTALDVTIQAQILDLLRDIQRAEGMSIALITHDLGVVAEMAQEVAVMYCGRVVERAPVAELFDNPAHPYTRGLLASLPRFDQAREALHPIPGTVPDAARLPEGCAFAPRCELVQPACTRQRPALRDVAHGHLAACRLDAEGLPV
jgi:peptide/nickel transport system ATP-binding protein